jgi:hypothetical protein
MIIGPDRRVPSLIECMTWEVLQGYKRDVLKLLFDFAGSVSTGREFAEIINDVYVIRKQVLKTTSFRRE